MGAGSDGTSSRIASVEKLCRRVPSAASTSTLTIRPAESSLAHHALASSRVAISKKAASSPEVAKPSRSSAARIAQSTVSSTVGRASRCGAGITRSGRS